MSEPSATEFTPNYVWFAGNGGYYHKDASQTTSTSVFYEMKTRDSSGNDTTPSWMVGQYGIEFRYENNNTVLYCNTGNNTDIPYFFAGGAVSQQVATGDTVTATLNDGTTAYTFVVTSSMLWTSGSGSGAGTSTQGVGWGGSFYNVTSSEFSYKVFHTSAFTSPQTYELHSTTLTPTFISDLVVGAASGSINSRTHTWGTPDVVEIRDAYGTVAAQLTLSHATASKKVFCNFW